MFTVFGVAYSFGAFFGSMADEFGADRAQTALFFSLTTFTYFLLGLVTGPLSDRHGPRRVLIIGALVMGVGLWLTSLAGSIVVGYVTYAFGVGVGVAAGYVPMVAIVGGWFTERRNAAIGLAVAGIGLGTLVAAPLAEWLISQHGWRVTYRIFAVASVALLLLAAVGADRPPNAAQATHVRLAQTLKGRWDFALLYGASLFLTQVLFIPFVFLDDYLEVENISGSAGVLVGLIGVSSIVGRLGLGALAVRHSSLSLMVGSFGVLSLSYLLWMAAGSSYVMLVVFVVVLGVAYGGFIALSPAVMAERFGVAQLGAVLGALYTSAGFGGLVGPPLAGWLIDRSGYRSTQIAALVAGLIATSLAACVSRTSIGNRS